MSREAHVRFDGLCGEGKSLPATLPFRTLGSVRGPPARAVPTGTCGLPRPGASAPSVPGPALAVLETHLAATQPTP